MKTIVKLATLTLGAAFLGNAAAETVLPPVPVAPLNDVYIAGEIGGGFLSTPDKDITGPGLTGGTHSNGHLSGGGNIGIQHAIRPQILLGAEFGYNYNGQSKYNVNTQFIQGPTTITSRITSQSFDLLGTGTYLFNNGLNIFGKAGAARVYQKLDLSDNIGVDISDGDTSVTQYHPMVATGLGYQFRQVDVYFQYAHIFGNDAHNFDDLFNGDGTFNGTVSTDTYQVGLAYHFNIL